MPQRQALRIVLAVGLGLGLAACSNVQETLGLTTEAPDEFAVYARAPLSQPPDFALLPPAPGTPRPQEATPTQQAQVTRGQLIGLARARRGTHHFVMQRRRLELAHGLTPRLDAMISAWRSSIASAQTPAYPS